MYATPSTILIALTVWRTFSFEWTPWQYKISKKRDIWNGILEFTAENNFLLFSNNNIYATFCCWNNEKMRLQVFLFFKNVKQAFWHVFVFSTFTKKELCYFWFLKRRERYIFKLVSFLKMWKNHFGTFSFLQKIKRSILLILVFETTRKMRVQACFHFKKCKASILACFRIYKLQKTIVLLLFVLLKERNRCVFKLISFWEV